MFRYALCFLGVCIPPFTLNFIGPTPPKLTWNLKIIVCLFVCLSVCLFVCLFVSFFLSFFLCLKSSLYHLHSLCIFQHFTPEKFPPKLRMIWFIIQLKQAFISTIFFRFQVFSPFLSSLYPQQNQRNSRGVEQLAALPWSVGEDLIGSCSMVMVALDVLATSMAKKAKDGWFLCKVRWNPRCFSLKKSTFGEQQEMICLEFFFFNGTVTMIRTQYWNPPFGMKILHICFPIIPGIRWSKFGLISSFLWASHFQVPHHPLVFRGV